MKAKKQKEVVVEEPPIKELYEWNDDKGIVVYDWERTPIAQAEELIGQLRQEFERGARILNERHSRLRDQKYNCVVCHKEILEGRWKGRDDTNKNPKTGNLEPVFLCSADCYSIYWSKKPRAVPIPR